MSVADVQQDVTVFGVSGVGEISSRDPRRNSRGCETDRLLHERSVQISTLRLAEQIGRDRSLTVDAPVVGCRCSLAEISNNRDRALDRVVQPIDQLSRERFVAEIFVKAVHNEESQKLRGKGPPYRGPLSSGSRGSEDSAARSIQTSCRFQQAAPGAAIGNTGA